MTVCALRRALDTVIACAYWTYFKISQRFPFIFLSLWPNRFVSTALQKQESLFSWLVVNGCGDCS